MHFLPRAVKVTKTASLNTVLSGGGLTHRTAALRSGLPYSYRNLWSLCLRRRLCMMPCRPLSLAPDQIVWSGEASHIDSLPVDRKLNPRLGTDCCSSHRALLEIGFADRIESYARLLTSLHVTTFGLTWLTLGPRRIALTGGARVSPSPNRGAWRHRSLFQRREWDPDTWATERQMQTG